MKHYTQDELSEYLDEEVTSDVAAEMKFHLGQCTECSEIVFRLTSYSNLIRHSQFKESDEFISESMTRLDNRRFKNMVYKKSVSVWEIVIPSVSVALSIFLISARPLYQANQTQSDISTESLLMSGVLDEESDQIFSFSNLLVMEER